MQINDSKWEAEELLDRRSWKPKALRQNLCKTWCCKAYFVTNMFMACDIPQVLKQNTSQSTTEVIIDIWTWDDTTAAAAAAGDPGLSSINSRSTPIFTQYCRQNSVSWVFFFNSSFLLAHHTTIQLNVSSHPLVYEKYKNPCMELWDLQFLWHCVWLLRACARLGSGT